MSDDVDIRVRMRGARQAEAEAHGVARGVDSIGGASARTVGHLGRLKAATAGVSGSLRSIGEASRTAGLHLGLAATGAAGFAGKVGFDFNRTLDGQRVAFTTFMHDGRKAADFMGQLRQLALQSPVLDPKSTGEAARMLMAYGLATKNIIPMVKAVGDMSAASGKSIAEVMPQAAMAIGQVASKGKLQAEELNQLAESVGLSRGRIRTALGMTRAEFEESFKPGQSISADKAIPAIQKAMEAQSRGASEMLAKTTGGQIDRLRDVFGQKMGEATQGLWGSLGKGAGGLAGALQGLDMKGIAGSIGGTLRSGLAVGRNALHSFLEAVKPAKPLWDNVLKPFLSGFGKGLAGSVVGALRVALPIVRGFMGVLGAIGRLARPLRPVFHGLGLVLGFVFAGPVLRAVGTLGELRGVFGVIATAAHALALPIRIVGGAFGYVFRTGARVVGLIGGKLFGVFGRLPGVLGRAAGGFRNFASAAWSAIRSGIGRIFGFISGLGGRFYAAGRGLVAKLVDGLRGIGQAIVRAFGSGIGFAGDIGRALADWLNANTPLGNRINLPSPLPDFTIPALANGGIARTPGAALVGEKGPELLRLPKGARVDPLPKRGPVGSRVDGGVIHVEAPLYLDGREVAVAVGRAVTDASNRR